jgi:hypothetical protein
MDSGKDFAWRKTGLFLQLAGGLTLRKKPGRWKTYPVSRRPARRFKPGEALRYP